MQATSITSDEDSRTALVIGGTGGIGGAISRAFANDGFKVIATGVAHEELESFHIQTDRIDARFLDVRSTKNVEQLVKALERIDVLINAAGIIIRDGEHDPEAFSQVVDINLNGMMRTCSAAKSLLVESCGCVVNIASMLSFFGSGPAPAYSASKGGVAQLTKSLAIDWARQNIRVNAVAPGWIETPLTSPLISDPIRHDTIRNRTPMARWGKPDDVVGAVQFLCSPAASFITGVVLPVDGGYSIA